MVKQEAITDIDGDTGVLMSRPAGALPGFYYRDGYTLCLADLGKAGVKIELIDAHEGSAAVILPPEKIEECSKWLSKTLGQRCHLLPQELSKILGRLAKEKRPNRILERGDKKTIKEALRLLKA
jgi:hypothetical protein